MVLPVHFKDWGKLDREDDFLDALKEQQIPPGNYMFPGWETPGEMKSEDYQKKYEAGPRGIISIFTSASMGRNLGLTFLYFLSVSFLLAYLGTIGLSPQAEALRVFRFFSTAAFMTFLGAMVPHAIWFQNRIVGHVIESIAYAAITGGIFAAMWPAA